MRFSNFGPDIRDFPKSLLAIPGFSLAVGHDNFFPHSFQLITHPLFYHSVSEYDQVLKCQWPRNKSMKQVVQKELLSEGAGISQPM
jgi:hypothetical protein